MIVGVPREIKDNEFRVAATPAGVESLVAAGHQVLVERQAGEGSGFSDAEYERAGARLCSAAEVWQNAALILKVKEPLPAEYPYLRPGLILFTYLHLAANEQLTRALLESGITAIAYETVQTGDGRLPLLTPMSEIAGRMSVQVGAHYLERMNGGRGKLLGGVPGVRPADVVIIGAGVVGSNAAQIALGMGAHVTLLDINVDRLRALDERLIGSFETIASNRRSVAEAVRYADVLIGAVLVPGAKAPRVVTREMVATMKPGTVIIDVAVDQGGCVETARPTTHSDPVYTVDGVIHYCVANMPGAVPRTSTYALSNVTLPYALTLASFPLAEAIARMPALASGVNIVGGRLTCPAVGEAFGLPVTPLAEALP
ncbi:MAG: alanine dehydrogenase [Chloroflexota bacterium]|nr:alanine dehydrogenase [Dehalococcoidia bacterium]MDW8254601.1 alanine dehydrogenase [Chloroflexota bacterium]